MAFLVRVMEHALSDLAYLYERVNAENSEAAEQWFNGLEEAINSLEEQPARCPLTPESNSLQALALRAQTSFLSRDLPHSRETETC
jgi:plasmid stabilization system protein ParE